MRFTASSETGLAGGSDRRGQSEVIGTILLVAFVLVLAAVAGEFVFGLDIVTSGEQTVGPQTSFEANVDVDDGTLTIEHEGGDTLDVAEITVVRTEHGEYTPTLGAEWDSGEVLTLSSGEIDDGETVRIVWAAAESDESNVIFEYEYRYDG